TCTVFFLRISNRAIAKPSPPLLPGPQNTVYFWGAGMWESIQLQQRIAALSIRSTELTGSFCMVYRSHCLICAAENSFMSFTWSGKIRGFIRVAGFGLQVSGLPCTMQ